MSGENTYDVQGICVDCLDIGNPAVLSPPLPMLDYVTHQLQGREVTSTLT